ncbi:MAG: TonB-dependent receptor plug domain-containing protein, partial [Nitrospinota bacterium]|nr:TonB-dependent receptor plug domain-containing protein [Nitrospinota bacterium]
MNNFIISGPVIVALKMRKFLITANLKAIMIAICFLSYGVFVPTPLKADETDEAALDLLKVFDEATEIATKSKLNADYVPGMVTVLHGKDLQARGVETLWEALTLVPGFDITINGSFKQVTVRGVGSTLASGNIKLLWNSIPMNTNIAGLNLQLLEFPVAQVERIEVIRGPGSAVHGEYALTGVVNVITRKQGSQVYGRGGSFETYGGGLLYSWVDPEGEMDLSFNVAGVTSDGPDVVTGPDVLGAAPFSNAPGPANENNDNLSSGLHFRYRKFFLDVQVLHSGWGDKFGPANALPQPIDNITYRLTTYALQGRQELDLGRSLQMNLKLGWWQDRIKWGDDSLVFPPGFPGFPNGMV